MYVLPFFAANTCDQLGKNGLSFCG